MRAAPFAGLGILDCASIEAAFKPALAAVETAAAPISFTNVRRRILLNLVSIYARHDNESDFPALEVPFLRSTFQRLTKRRKGRPS